ncbi:hypothetical protein NEMBOFW57_004190 [Staphylotrichum longicolle]|uniref:C3H1-type domain-containing protein n=1 Tax=Staphylotrichum longicolle TaxID=669026 RepID=A0AAD4F6Y6_9PEZI|nr:hypothetical protein NEMBOFW57_004190 [Staphylotrichum longicolle]
MLSDPEIERAAAQLADYKRSDALSKLLDQYSVMIEDYKRLKSDYEEERESREKYKQMAKDQERNPFVLVLVDGDGYVFNDDYLSKRAEGGSAAAQALNDEVKASLRRKGLEHCQVMVRIYANVFGLSKVLSKTGVVGADSRSLAPFIASFNRSYGLTEFVDAGQLKENADFKLRALIRLYADSSQCKHIYFAACHDVGYISELTPFMGNSSKFTLVNTPGIRFHDEFTKLGMGIEEFRGVFRHSPLDGNVHYPSTAGTSGKPISTPTQPPPSPAKQSFTPGSGNTDNQRPVCLFHSLGKCRYGKSCKMLHVNPPVDAKPARQYPDLPSPTPSSAPTNGTPSLGPSLQNPTFLAKLPQKDDIPPGCVAVNDNNYRLDPYLPPINPDVMSRLKARVDKRRVCNSFHLQGSCDAGDRCEYDHEPLEPEFLPALESLARSQPCPRRGACRLEGCTHGHICQNSECKHRGGKVYCKLPYLSHLEAPAVARYVPSVPKQGRKPSSGTPSSTTSG